MDRWVALIRILAGLAGHELAALHGAALLPGQLRPLVGSDLVFEFYK
jgi:hypothetical protein